MDEYIKDGKLAVLSLKNFYNTILTADINQPDHIIRIPIDDFFLKYRAELDTAAQWYNLPDSRFYKPKTLSMELYGTPELWLALLRLNSMRNITEFCQSIIQIYHPGYLKELIGIFFKRENKIT
jgi:hypothetical protein